jgi:hypothetical protein
MAEVGIALVHLEEKLMAARVGFVDLWSANLVYGNGVLHVIDPGGFKRLEPGQKPRLIDGGSQHPTVLKAAKLYAELRDKHSASMNEAEIRRLVGEYVAEIENAHAAAGIDKSFDSIQKAEERQDLTEKYITMLARATDPVWLDKAVSRMTNTLETRSNSVIYELHESLTRDLRKALASANLLHTVFSRTRDVRVLDILLRAMEVDLLRTGETSHDYERAFAQALPITNPSWNTPQIELSRSMLVRALNILDRIVRPEFRDAHAAAMALVPQLARQPGALLAVNGGKGFKTSWLLSTLVRGIDAKSITNASALERERLTTLLKQDRERSPQFAAAIDKVLAIIQAAH